MKRIVALALVVILVGAAAPSAVFAGVEPSPFRDEANKLEAIASRLESSHVQLADLLADPTALPDKAVENRLKSLASRIDRDLTATEGVLEEIEFANPGYPLPAEVMAPMETIFLEGETIQAICEPHSGSGYTYEEQVTDIIAAAQILQDVLEGYLSYVLTVEVEHVMVPYGEMQTTHAVLRDGRSNPLEGVKCNFMYSRTDTYETLAWTYGVTDAEGRVSTTWLPAWTDPSVAGAPIQVKVFAVRSLSPDDFYDITQAWFELGTPGADAP